MSKLYFFKLSLYASNLEISTSGHPTAAGIFLFMYPWNPERYIVKSVLMSKKNTEKTLMAILLAFYSSPVKAKFSQMISSGSKIPSMSRLLPNKRCCFFSFLEDRKQDSRQFLGYYSLYLSRTVLLVSQCLNTTKMY